MTEYRKMKTHKLISDIWDENGDLNREDASIILACETFTHGARRYSKDWDAVTCKNCLRKKDGN